MKKRILKNHIKLCNNIDNFNNYFENEYDDNILISLLDKINDFPIEENIKYQISLENISNILNENNIYYNQNLFVDNITEYFLYNNLYHDNMINILENVYLKKKPDLDNSKKLISKFPKNPIKTKIDVKNIIKKFYTLSKDNIIDETPNMLIWIRKGVVYSTFAVNIYLGALSVFIDYFISLTIQREDVKKVKNKLKSEKEIVEKKLNKIKNNDKKIEELKKYIKEIEDSIYKIEIYEESLYTEKELEEKDEEEMNLESTINNICFTKDEYYNSYHKYFVNEIIKTKNILDRSIKERIDFKKMKDDGSILIVSDNDINNFLKIEYDDLNNYLDVDNRISYRIVQILPNNSKWLHEEMIRNIYEEIYNKLNNEIDDDLIITIECTEDIINIYITLSIPISNNDNNTHIDVKSDFAIILTLSDYIEKVNKKINDINIMEYCDLEEEEIQFITEFVMNNDVIDKNIIIENFKNLKSDLYKKDTNDKFIKGSILQESIYQLSNRKNKVYNYKNRYQVLAETINLNEELSIINELSTTNKLKLAKNTLVKNIKNMSDKEKMISKTLDNALEKFYNSVDKELSNKSREKVIKGSILPSASTIVKIALTSGAVWFINPALSVITILGSLALSKRVTMKEKQYILDEINIMLKVCEKKIQLAESNNDMKSLEQLLRTQQKLERERQRIKYNLRRKNNPITSY